jgi:hypothetical protein
MTPLEAINWSQIAFLAISETEIIKKLSGSICIPDPDIFLLEFLGVSRTSNEPFEKILDYSKTLEKGKRSATTAILKLILSNRV